MKINVKIPKKINIGEIKTGTPPYKLPIASKDVLGGIKVGENLTIDEDGRLNASSGGSDVDLSNYVEKEEGKGLSTEDFTTEEKDKLNSVQYGANVVYVDDKLDNFSINPVQNKVITAKLNIVESQAGMAVQLLDKVLTDMNNKADKTYVDNAISEAIGVALEGEY